MSEVELCDKCIGKGRIISSIFLGVILPGMLAALVFLAAAIQIFWCVMGPSASMSELWGGILFMLLIVGIPLVYFFFQWFFLTLGRPFLGVICPRCEGKGWVKPAN